ncbi:MAG: T9SS type A sorting domain-containing protein [Ignavibacteriae bacterium]|nr:T9SS type A sorting domain-containing protein [Ignavibacteriota bacterium]
MTHKLLLLFVLLCVVVAIACAGSGTKPTQSAQVQVDQSIGRDAPIRTTADYLTPFARPTVGSYTTLTGYYDWQSNGGAVQHIQVNPANGNIHVTYMVSDDSTQLAASRRSAYAFSTDGGGSWNNFSNVRVPSRASGYPVLTLLKGANAGLPAIANHSTITGTQSTVFVDSPEGTGAFSELNAPPIVSISGTLQPIWPNIAGAADGSINMTAALNVAAVPYYSLRTRTTDFSTWSAWQQTPDSNGTGGRYPTYANDNGYVGTLLYSSNTAGVWWHFSTNNGVTWSSPAQNIYPPSPPGRETAQGNCRIWVGVDFLWDGNTPLMVLNEQTLGTGRNNQGRIAFWSQATGYVDVADSSNTPGYNYPLNLGQSNHLTMGWSTIGKSGNTLVIVFQGLTADTSAVGFNFGDLFFCKSTNNGATWTAPVNFTQTRNLDERYPSISRYNPAGFIYMTWQEDTQPGSAAFTDGAPLSRARQVFYKLSTTTGVNESGTPGNSFALKQNYPNPFNPATKIEYSVAHAGPVSIKVYNALGQEVRTLLDEELVPGQYELSFNGAGLSSGVYFYKMAAAGYAETKRMALLK